MNFRTALRFSCDLENYCDLLRHAEDELKRLQTRMVRDGFRGNAKDRVSRALRNIRKAHEQLRDMEKAEL